MPNPWLPLDGITVVDFSMFVPGPFCSAIFADLGAEVIKVEAINGDPGRGYVPVQFRTENRNKRSIAINLKAPESKAIVRKLAEKADIALEGFRPGVAKRLGIDYHTLAAHNPKIVYCSISGYGQTGPRAGEAGHDLNYIGNTGLLALQPGPAERPVVPPALVADIAGGSFPAMINILLALRQRDLTGEGSHVDIAMADAMFTFAWYAMAEGQATGRFPGPGELRLVGGSPRYQLYPTRDGKLVACAALEQKFWMAFAGAIGLPPDRTNDLADPAATKAAVAAIIAREDAAHWRPILAQADCCVTIVASLEEALRDPHFVGRGLFAHSVTGATGAAMTALPVPIAPEFRGRPQAKPVSSLGSNTNEAFGLKA